MKKILSYCLVATIVLGMASCGDGNDPNAIKLSKNAERIGLAGGSVKIELTSPSAWSATASEDWVTINPSSGLGDAFVTITVASGTKGTATIIFANANGSVKMVIARSDDEGDTPPDPQNPDPQDPPTPDTPDPSITFSVTPTTINAFVAGGSYDLDINSNTAWEASCEQSWAHLSATSGPGDGKYHLVTVTVDQATSKAETSQKITFKVGKNTYYVTIKQAGLGNFNPNIPSPTGLTVEKVMATNAACAVDHMHLSWQPVTGAIEYKVYREDVCDYTDLGFHYGDIVMPNTVIATVTETKYDDADRKEGGGWLDEYLGRIEMSVRYSVTAVTSSGESVPCKPVCIYWDKGV